MMTKSHVNLCCLLVRSLRVISFWLALMRSALKQPALSSLGLRGRTRAATVIMLLSPGLEAVEVVESLVEFSSEDRRWMVGVVPPMLHLDMSRLKWTRFGFGV